MLRVLRILGIFLLSFLAVPVFADISLPPPVSLPVPTNNLPVPNRYFPISNNASYQLFNLPARVSGWALGGDYFVGMGDAMVPLVGNDYSMLYTDIQGKYASGDWFAGAGLGLRGIYNDQRILGGYVFVDRNQFTNSGNLANTNFWFISPGLESMGNIWDFRVNGYFPLSSQHQHLATTFADNLGNFEFVVFRFHQQYNHFVDILNVTGYGADAEIGRVVPGFLNTRVYLGGYYFGPKDTNTIRGIEGRINIPFNHYIALTAADSYDNYTHNSIEAGIKFTLGGIDDDVDKDNHDISRRMLDPLSRNLATLAQGTAQPIKKITKDEGKLVLERDNIYFFTTTDGSAFDPANGTNNCTFEHPCQASDFSQTTLDSLNIIAPNTNFYLDPGNYSFAGTGLGLTINNGQSIFGRTVGYRQPASGNDRPILISGDTFVALTPLGNNILDSLQLTAGGGSIALVGVDLNNATNVLISNSQIGNPASPSDFVVALLMTDSQARVVNSTLSADFDIGGGVFAVFAGGNSILTLDNSTVLAQASDPAAPIIGINAGGNAQVTVSNSNISATNTDPAGSAIGVQSNDSSQVSISGSRVSATAPAVGNADPLQQNGASTITVINSHCFQNGAEVVCTP